MNISLYLIKLKMYHTKLITTNSIDRSMYKYGV